MILDPAIVTEILLDGPSAQVASEAIRSISGGGEVVAPTLVGAGEIARYMIFLGKIRPFLIRLDGTRHELETFLEYLFRTASSVRQEELSHKIMLESYRLSVASSLNFSLAHLATTASVCGDSVLCARDTLATLASSPLLTIAIIKDHSAAIAEITIKVSGAIAGRATT